MGRCLLVVLGCLFGTSAAGQVGADESRFEVSRVLGQGHIVLRLDGRDMLARLSGVAYDGPTQALEDLLQGPVTLVLQAGRAVDATGTPLVELYRDGRCLNELILRRGLGRVDRETLMAPRRLEHYLVAEREAREAELGLWLPSPHPSIISPMTPPESEVVRASVPPPASITPTPAELPRLSPDPDVPTVVPELSQSEPEAGPVPEAARGDVMIVTTPAQAEFTEPSSWTAWGDRLWDWGVSTLTVPVSLSRDDLASLAASRLAFAAFGAWVARQKRRRRLEGLLLGAAFGPLGVLIEALLPLSTTPAANPPATPGLEAIVGRGQPQAAPGSARLSDSHDFLPIGTSVLWEHSDELPVDDSLLRDEDDDLTTSEASRSGSPPTPASLGRSTPVVETPQPAPH
jgi:hypothetical protein